MTSVLSREQIEDLAEIQAIAAHFDADLVIIGAVALLCFLNDLGRFTRDIDLVIALDFDRFPEFAAMLGSHGWTMQRRLEHRWPWSGITSRTTESSAVTTASLTYCETGR